MQRTRIEWADHTWNPVMGLCPVDCKLPDGRSYCYARRMYKRFKWMDSLDGVDEKAILMKEWELYEPAKLKKPSKIFVCSTIELFHPEVKFNTGAIFNVIKENPQHTFQILTKFPQNIDRAMPDNVWLGVTVTKGSDEGWRKIYDLDRAKAKLKFISFEPLLGLLNQSFISNAESFDWFIFGRLTGYGKEHDPDKRWIEPAIDYFRGYKKPVFLKNNLKEIWGEPLIQEFPDV